MKKVDIYLFVLLFLLALLSRFPFVEKIQSHWDGPDYSIAVVRYSLEQHTPTAPGYPFYIALGKFFYLFFHDPHNAILAVSVLGSILGAIIFYFVGKNIYKSITVGITASLLFLTGSTFYYFGLTPYAYGLLPAATTLLAYIVYLILFKNKQLGMLLGLVFGIYFGIRPQEVLQIGLLPLVGFIFLTKRQKLFFLLIFIFVTICWVLPVAQTSGGINNFLTYYREAAQNGFLAEPLQQHIEIMIKGFLLSFGAASIFILYYFKYLFKKISKKNWKFILFYCSWIVPGFLFNLFIRTDHAGYQMSYLSGFVLLIAYALWQTTKKPKIVLIITIILVSLFNLYWFFYDRDPTFIKPIRPTSFHYSDIRKNDLKTGGKIAFVQKHFNPKTTLIISTETLWRPYAYHLYNFHIVALNALDNTVTPYKYYKQDGFQWNAHQYQENDFFLTIPKEVKTIVVMDDPARSWIKTQPFTTYHLPGNSFLISFSVQPNNKLFYNYHFLKIVQ